MIHRLGKTGRPARASLINADRGHGLRGFTLVELMVAIAIIAILATSLLVGLNSARESSRASKTRTTINKLHEVVITKWESYLTRRVPQDLSNLQVSRLNNTRLVARYRLATLRELMRLEMPDRFSDFLDAGKFLPAASSVPAVTRAYQNQYSKALARAKKSSTTDALPRNQGAECLYMIVTLGATEDFGGLENFRKSEIGDVDGDGLNEFIDGWGQPIDFIRWPSGFTWLTRGVSKPELLSELNDTKAPDPFNPLQIANPSGNKGFLIFPLVYSAGPDKKYALVTSQRELQYATVQNDPYTKTGEGDFIGEPAINSDGVPTYEHLDNIHNHQLGVLR